MAPQAKLSFFPQPTPPVLPAQSNSRLLSLPGEVRNLIFKYALTTTDDGLQPQIVDSGDIYPQKFRYALFPQHSTWNTREPADEFNQLKYVNKQLRKETKSLELQYNAVIFDEIIAPASVFDFMDGLQSKHRTWLTEVVVCFSDEWHADFMIRDSFESITQLSYVGALANLCKKHAHVKFRAVLKGWGDMAFVHPRGFYLLGYSLGIAITGFNRYSITSVYDGWELAGLARIFRRRSHFDVFFAGVDNLFFYPSVRLGDVKNMFQGWKDRNTGESQEDVKQWVRCAKLWMVHGIQAA